MNGKLVIAVPSKGRLQENASAFFARAGLPLVQEGGARNYRGSIKGLPDAEVLFLSASDIVAKLASGEAHFGVTGEDLVRESIPDADRKVALLLPLGFGHADVVVAVPKGWIDARTMEDLEEIAADFHARRGRRMRVATKYVNLTRRFLASHGVADYRIVESLGATEGAPAAGAAELIVDITTTGATLEANALKVLDDGVILRSQANLVASKLADWNEVTFETARRALRRISAEHAARTQREIRVGVDAAMRDNVAEEALGLGATAIGESENSLVWLAPSDAAAAMADRLVAVGAASASVGRAEYVFGATSPLLDAFEAAIGQAAAREPK
jgi:ATP phosphoribosyltransferase